MLGISGIPTEITRDFGVSIRNYVGVKLGNSHSGLKGYCRGLNT